MEPLTTVRLCLTHLEILGRHDSWCPRISDEGPPCEVRTFALLPLDVD
jgi:hypothetical protein